MIALVFFVVLFRNDPVMTVGPVAEAACSAHITEERGKIAAFFADPAKAASAPPYRGAALRREEIVFACAPQRPEIKGPVETTEGGRP